jgi:hypothetical protein
MNANFSADSYAEPASRVSLVHCTTTAGPVSFKLFEKWSPHGYDRALELFWRGFYDGTHFYSRNYSLFLAIHDSLSVTQVYLFNN